MKYLYYTNYLGGASGLSNGIMSIEVGVVLAHLADRLLVIEGDRSPPANVVSYDGLVSNDRPSKVSDLLEIPVPWMAAEQVELAGLESVELTDAHLWDTVFYHPPDIDRGSPDFDAFRHMRPTELGFTDDLQRLPVLRLSEDPRTPDGQQRRNLCFYSYLFYLDPATRRRVNEVLRRMRPKAPLADLAKKVAGDLGRFNAVHLRRGDFKITYGVTTLERRPWEAIEALDHHFDRRDLLVIVTDEAEDPFFDEIKAAYPHHLFIDHHILAEYGRDFERLPCRDSLALAFLSQLVAAESQDFIGTMTSTFTSMIQRMRGNRGKHEPFKFLWNELPDEGDRLERGRHAISHCVPLERGVMVEEFPGPYSWNRYNRRLNPGWMREWPESFLSQTPATTQSGGGHLATHGDLATRHGQTASQGVPRALAPASRFQVSFGGFQVTLLSPTPLLHDKVSRVFSLQKAEQARNVVAEIEIHPRMAAGYALALDGETVCEGLAAEELMGQVKRLMMLRLATIYRGLGWLEGHALMRQRDGRTVLLVGERGDGQQGLGEALREIGWRSLGDEILAVRPALDRSEPRRAEPGRRPSVAVLVDHEQADGPQDAHEASPDQAMLWPLGLTNPGLTNQGLTSHGLTAGPTQEAPSTATNALDAIVLCAFRLQARTDLRRLSPSLAVADLLPSSPLFASEPERALRRLCEVIETVDGYQLTFHSSSPAAEILDRSLGGDHE